jgi:hypothetical protein
MSRAVGPSNRRLLRARDEQDSGIDCALRDPFGNTIRILQPATSIR